MTETPDTGTIVALAILAIVAGQIYWRVNLASTATRLMRAKAVDLELRNQQRRRWRRRGWT